MFPPVLSPQHFAAAPELPGQRRGLGAASASWRGWQILATAVGLTTFFVTGLNSAEITPAKPVVADQFTRLAPGAITLQGDIQDRIQQQIDQRFDDNDLRAMVEFFRRRNNDFAAGEIWGKTVRAMCRCYQYSLDPRLKASLDRTVADLLSTQTPDGCISSFSKDKQPYNADVWCRKYTLLGLQAYYGITHDGAVLDAMMKMADYTLAQIGPAPKVRIVNTGWAFDGIESSSIIEPMVKLYDLTGQQRYLDFVRYVVETEGGCKRENIYESVFKGRNVRDIGSNGDPKKSIAKQYELTSNFEGLTEYFRATGNAHWKDAALLFQRNAQATETTVIGCGGGLGSYNLGPAPTEQFNDSYTAQTLPTRDGIEGCAIARWMGLNDQLLRLTGDPALGDHLEQTLYNALLGCIKPDGTRVDYHTRLHGTRSTPVNFKVPINGKPINCCLYNVVDALAMIPGIAVMESASGPVVNLFLPATATARLSDGNRVTLKVATEYPTKGLVSIGVTPRRPGAFSLRVRIPAWSRQTRLMVNGMNIPVTPGTYAEIHRDWAAGDRVELNLDLRCRMVAPPVAASAAGKEFRAVVRGPITLARDKRLGEDLGAPVDFAANPNGNLTAQLEPSAIGARVQVAVPTQDGRLIRMIDFASAGATWTPDSEYLTWVPTSPASSVPPPTGG